MVKWPILHNKHTVTSFHRSVQAPSGIVPRDSLDIHLSSCYQHNLELFPENTDVMRHPSRLHESTQQIISPNISTTVQPQEGIICGGIKARPSIHSVKLSISANHIAQTNRGFSRKLDGTFYTL
ncbi:uncharacterized protein C1orf194 homolog [Homalodisca vitripennis]|uniref:uncharacterized protein C1orf194 homolog n=1 Tax=Homalodisca vitripennis TaxID=197043 RepID=UPI001EEA4417|nr:uncharacterized protein C1orf194 homolog [Homalodisca vitripennis]KAG8309986.1 hypothetical protein J6590_072386 [Homalodisca vitripennis]